jgi:hypothetical protein
MLYDGFTEAIFCDKSTFFRSTDSLMKLYGKTYDDTCPQENRLIWSTHGEEGRNKLETWLRNVEWNLTGKNVLWNG